MTDYEKKMLRIFKGKIQTFLERNMDKEYILEWLDTIIYNSFDDLSSEYYSELYKMQEMLLKKEE